MRHVFLDDTLEMLKELRDLLITAHVDLYRSFDEIDHSRVRQYVKSLKLIEQGLLLFHVTEVSRWMNDFVTFDSLQQLERGTVLELSV